MTRPQRVVIEGRCVTIEPLDPAKHTEALWQGLGGEANDSLRLYMPDGPFRDRAAFDAHMQAKAISEDPLFFAIVDKKTGLALGRSTLMRIDPPNRVIEVGGNALNEHSRRAALRLGVSFEGIFRQHMIIKGKNRDSGGIQKTRLDSGGG